MAKIAKPKVLVMTGYGINCDEETAFAFQTAGERLGYSAKSDIVHVTDLVEGLHKMHDYQIIAFPGGFSWGDDTGSGKALANRVKDHLWDETMAHVDKGGLVIGICNGFQALANMGLVPAVDGQYGERQVALVHNDNARYLDRWVDLYFHGKGPWVEGLQQVSCPIAHGEGKFHADPLMLMELKTGHQIAAKYFKGEACKYQGMTENPNGSREDIAAITDPTGRVIGMMPHPERAIKFTHLPWWPLEKEKLIRAGEPLPEDGPGLEIFINGLKYFE